jgi:hypothetical protein
MKNNVVNTSVGNLFMLGDMEKAPKPHPTKPRRILAGSSPVVRVVNKANQHLLTVQLLEMGEWIIGPLIVPGRLQDRKTSLSLSAQLAIELREEVRSGNGTIVKVLIR